MSKKLTLGQIELIASTLNEFHNLQADLGVYVIDAEFTDADGVSLGRVTWDDKAEAYDWEVAR